MCCAPHLAQAQKFAVSTNALTWANFGTINAEGSFIVSRHITLHAGGTANPWEITTPTKYTIRNRQYGGYVGARYWPWHVYSEWWVGAKLQYKNFEQMGLMTTNLIKGDAAGAGVSAGYTFMLSRHFNIDLGLGVWGGSMFRYKEYLGTVANENEIAKQGPRGFFFLDNMIISFAYIF